MTPVRFSLLMFASVSLTLFGIHQSAVTAFWLPGIAFGGFVAAPLAAAGGKVTNGPGLAFFMSVFFYPIVFILTYPLFIGLIVGGLAGAWAVSRGVLRAPGPGQWGGHGGVAFVGFLASPLWVATGRFLLPGVDPFLAGMSVVVVVWQCAVGTALYVCVANRCGAGWSRGPFGVWEMSRP